MTQSLIATSFDRNLPGCQPNKPKERSQMKSLLETLKRDRRTAAECLRAEPLDQSLRWTLADIQNSIAAVEAVIAELPTENKTDQDIHEMVTL
jgi:hypothetical protein